MKKKFTAKDILIPTVSLFVICLVVTALLAVTNMLTAPQIQKLSKETEDKTKAEVLASADEFSDALTVSADGKDYTYYEGTASGDTIGYGRVNTLDKRDGRPWYECQKRELYKSVHRKVRYDRRFQKRCVRYRNSGSYGSYDNIKGSNVGG